MVTRNGDTLTYDPQQRLTGYDTSSVDDTYWYTTSNQRLIRQHGSTVTLYLGDMEIAHDGTNTTVTRTISIAGTPVATRTTINGGTASIAWNCANMQNSTICQAPAATTASPPIPGRKRYTPYGGDRNTTPYTNTDHGFLNQPEDTTGLTYLNNRYYDPQLAAFISVDPLVGKTGTPYLYSAGSPVRYSDSRGLAPSDCELAQDCPDQGKRVRYVPLEEEVESGGLATSFGCMMFAHCERAGLEEVAFREWIRTLKANMERGRTFNRGWSMDRAVVPPRGLAACTTNGSCQMELALIQDPDSGISDLCDVDFCDYVTVTFAGMEGPLVEDGGFNSTGTFLVGMTKIACSQVCTIPNAVWMLMDIDAEGDLPALTGTADFVVTTWSRNSETGESTILSETLVSVKVLIPALFGQRAYVLENAGDVLVVGSGTLPR